MCATRATLAQSGEAPLPSGRHALLRRHLPTRTEVACIAVPWLPQQRPKCCMLCHGRSQCRCWACPPCPVWSPQCCMFCPGQAQLSLLPHCGSASAMSRHGSMASLVDAAGPPAGGAPQGLTEHTALTERTWSAPGHIDVALQQQQQLEPRSSGLGAVGATGAGSMTVAVASTASSVGHSPGETCCSMPMPV